MKKPIYKRKRLWIPLILLIAISIPFVINPLNSFRKTVTFVLRIRGIQEHTVRSERYAFHYYEGGTDKPEMVILLHGFGGNALLTWMQLLGPLARKYHVVAPDLLASNFLQLNPKTYSIDAEVDLVMKMMEALRIQKADFVGLSVGGWVSLILALEHPELVNRLILVESAGIKTEVPELARLTLTDREKAKRFMKLLFFHPPPLPGFVLDQLIKSSTRIKTKYEAVFLGFIENSQGRLLDDKLNGITQPVLIIHGRNDLVIPLEVGERLHQLIPKSEMIILENSGHGAVWDSPFQLKRAILDFLQKPLPQ